MVRVIVSVVVAVSILVKLIVLAVDVVTASDFTGVLYRVTVRVFVIV